MLFNYFPVSLKIVFFILHVVTARDEFDAFFALAKAPNLVKFLIKRCDLLFNINASFNN